MFSVDCKTLPDTCGSVMCMCGVSVSDLLMEYDPTILYLCQEYQDKNNPV